MRRRLNILLVLMLAVRSLLPAGFMLQQSAVGDGTLAIVICTGHGPQTVTLDADGKPVPAKNQGADASLCPYASAGAVAPGDDAPPTLVTEAHYAAITYRITRELFRAGPKPGATSARGPPHFQT